MAWNRSSEEKKVGVEKRGGQRNVHLKGLIAGAIVVVGAAIAAWLLWPEGVARVKQGTSSPVPARQIKSDVGKKSRLKPIERREVVKTGEKVADALAEVESIEPLKIAPMPVTSKLKGLRLKRPFKSGVEQLLSWVFCIEPGEMPVPIPSISEEDRQHLAEILISRNEIEEDDTPAVIAMKETVDYAKKEMIKYIKNGGDPDDFIRYYHRELNKAFEIRNEAISQAAALAEEEPELAREFVKKVNEKFSNDGIKPLDIREFGQSL